MRKAKTSSPKKYKWDLYEDGITQSGLTTWLRCPEHFYLAYVEGWTPDEPSRPLAFGSMFHDLLAKAAGNASAVPELVKARRRKITGMKFLSVDARKRKAEILDQVDILLRNWFWFWKKQDQKRRWKSREEVFRVSFCSESDESFDLRGRWDGVYTRQRQPCLHEAKTKENIDEQGIQSSLHLDFQTMFYAYTHYCETEKVFSRILYDVARRPLLRQRTKPPEDYEDFLSRLETDITQERPAWYYMRWEVNLTPELMDDWLKKVLHPVLYGFELWYMSVKSCWAAKQSRWDSRLHYLNPDALLTRGGGHSEFFDLITRGSTYGLHRRSVPFPELED